MISAFTQKISELETKVAAHERNLEELILERGIDNANGTGPPSKEIEQILLGFQGELKDQSFAVNTLSSRVYCHEEELRVLRTYIQEKISKEDEVEMLKKLVAQLCDDRSNNAGDQRVRPILPMKQKQKQKPKGDTKTHQINGYGLEGSPTKKMQLNPEVAEFKPRGLLSADTVEQITMLPHNQSPQKMVPMSMTEKDKMNGDSKNIVPVHQLNCKNDKDTILEGMNKKSQPPKEPAIINENDLEDTSFSPEVMQQKLYEKNRIILEAEWRLEEALNHEAEMAQQLTWAEHKIRLLKQDKRRRGETIGKLLRCIDDLKDIGKLDLTTASSERAILTTTLSTRGMPHDERIQVAINVTEAERLHQYRPGKNSPRFGPDGMELSIELDESPRSGSQGSSVQGSYACSPNSFTEPEMEL